MKLVYLLPSLRVSGATIIYEQADRLAELGHDVHITSLDELVGIDLYPFKIIPQKLQDSLKDFETADAIIAMNAVCAFYINDLETQARKYYLLINEEFSFYPKELFKAKYKNLDDDRIKIERDAQRKYLEASYNLKLRYIVTNDDLAAMLKQFGKKADVVPVGVNPKLFYPDVGIIKGSKPRIVVEGSLAPWKGIKIINRALTEFANEFELWSISDGPAPLKSDKHWRNPDYQTVRKILSSADILIRAYSEDGVAELQAWAMACGCAVLTTETSGTKMFCDDTNSVIVKAGDYKQLTKELKSLIKSKIKREELIRNGLETAKKLNWESSIKVLESVLKGRRSHGGRSSQTK